eukprot:GAHX01002556.1.p1 GENE.GAHX01002556.1~~GAHX01002556.1.p1  ORF type:complete len:99 (+),score=14.81 GAHX01002556.1:34-330(+)
MKIAVVASHEEVSNLLLCGIGLENSMGRKIVHTIDTDILENEKTLHIIKELKGLEDVAFIIVSSRLYDYVENLDNEESLIKERPYLIKLPKLHQIINK